MLHTSPCKTRNALTNFLRQKLVDHYDLENEEFEKCIRGQIGGFLSTLNKKWKESNRCTNRVLLKNENWLQLDFNFAKIKNIKVEPSGRPRKFFADPNERSKRRHVKNIKSTTSSKELIHATKSVLYA